MAHFAVHARQSAPEGAEGEIERFLAAGYTKANILEVVLGVALKTLSNYTNHIADTPLDAAFAPQQWRKAS